METKVFSVKDGTLQVIDNIVVLWEDVTDEIPIATTPSDVVTDNVYTIPSTLIRKPKTDEELAEEYVESDETGWGKNVNIKHPDVKLSIKSFLAGLKARGGEFHLTREQIEKIYDLGYVDNRNEFEQLISSLTPLIYPTKITVEHDGEKYLWETIKAEY